MNNLTYSKIESDRFNKLIHRGFLEKIDIQYINNYINSNSVEILIIRLPVSEQASLYKLNDLNHEIIFADSLLYYKNDLKYLNSKIKNSELDFFKAQNENLKDIKELTHSIFNNYTNHYSSNPQLDKIKIKEGYIEWALNHLNNENKLIFIAKNENENVGFAACSFNNKFADGILFGILPSYTGKGYFKDLLRYCLNYFKEIKLESMLYSTQLQNIPVQRAITQEGFIIDNALITIHINIKKVN